MPNSIERSIKGAEVSLLMEGFVVTDACKELCRKLLSGEITLEQYLACVTPGDESITGGSSRNL